MMIFSVPDNCYCYFYWVEIIQTKLIVSWLNLSDKRKCVGHQKEKNTVGSFSTKEHHNRGLSFPGSTYIDWSTQDNNVNPVDLEA